MRHLYLNFNQKILLVLYSINLIFACYKKYELIDNKYVNFEGVMSITKFSIA